MLHVRRIVASGLVVPAGASCAALTVVHALAQPATRPLTLRPAFEDGARSRATRCAAPRRAGRIRGPRARCRISTIRKRTSCRASATRPAPVPATPASSRPIRAAVRPCARDLRRPTRSGPPGRAGAALAHRGGHAARPRRCCARPCPARRCARPHRRRNRDRARPSPRPRPRRRPPRPRRAIRWCAFPTARPAGGVAGTVNTTRLTTAIRGAAAPPHRRRRGRVCAARRACRYVPGAARDRDDRRLRHQSGAHAERTRVRVRHRLAGTARALRLAAPRGDRGPARQLYGLRQDARARPAGCRRQGDRALRRHARHRADRRGHADRRHRQSGQPERAGGAGTASDLHHARRHVRPDAALQPRRGHRQGRGRAHRIPAVAVHRRHHPEQRRPQLQSLRRLAAHQLRPDAGAEALRRVRRRHARARSRSSTAPVCSAARTDGSRKVVRHSNSRASSPARSRSAGSIANTSTRHCRS